MQNRATLQDLVDARGAPVYDTAGERIGHVEEIFYDHETDTPEWLGLGTGFFGTKRVLVPAEGARPSEDGFAVPYAKDMVKDSPDIDSDEISEQTERELYSYYGLKASERRSASVLPEGRAGGTAREKGDTGTSMTRSEEEVHVGKERVETGGVRLKKWVETEHVEVPVELRKEKIAVDRESLDQPISREEIGDDELEVTTSEERPVVEKRAVAKERVSVGKETESRRETVDEDVRKERVDVDEPRR